MGKQVAARLKKNITANAVDIIQNGHASANLGQQGSAVLDRTGFTSDQRVQEIEFSND